MENSILCKEIEQIKEDLKTHEKRLNNIEQDKKLQIFQYETIMKAMSEMKSDIKEIKGQSSKKFDLIISTIITATLSSGITLIIAKILK